MIDGYSNGMAPGNSDALPPPAVRCCTRRPPAPPDPSRDPRPHSRAPPRAASPRPTPPRPAGARTSAGRRSLHPPKSPARSAQTPGAVRTLEQPPQPVRRHGHHHATTDRPSAQPIPRSRSIVPATGSYLCALRSSMQVLVPLLLPLPNQGLHSVPTALHVAEVCNTGHTESVALAGTRPADGLPGFRWHIRERRRTHCRDRFVGAVSVGRGLIASSCGRAALAGTSRSGSMCMFWVYLGG